MMELTNLYTTLQSGWGEVVKLDYHLIGGRPPANDQSIKLQHWAKVTIIPTDTDAFIEFFGSRNMPAVCQGWTLQALEVVLPDNPESAVRSLIEMKLSNDNHVTLDGTNLMATVQLNAEDLNL